uniref:Bestrophin homolog n=1 Tax=Acrobeloides nanus TaxID=290746 RepID=A0A914DCP0_9BILA
MSELLLWIVLYSILSAIYRNFLIEEYQIIFEKLCVFFYTFADYIPLNFMLGFYVTAVYGRWTNYVNDIGWIDTPCLFISTNIHGTNDTARLIRRNLVRYMVLTQAMVYRTVCVSVKRRFPTLEHLVTSGLMTKSELKSFNEINSPNDNKFWVPMEWCFNLLRQARLIKMIDSDIIYTQLIDKIGQYRSTLLNLAVYDWIPIPLVYTQVVTLAVRFYFIFALFGRQYLKHDYNTPYSETIDLYIPILSIFQFIFYVGWMKVAEVMLNPLGDDDEDLELNYIIDRNLQVGLLTVDKCYGLLPDQEKDMFWKENHPEPLYTKKSSRRRQNPMIGSCVTPPIIGFKKNGCKRRCCPKKSRKRYVISRSAPNLSHTKTIVSLNKSNELHGQKIEETQFQNGQRGDHESTPIENGILKNSKIYFQSLPKPNSCGKEEYSIRIPID